MYHGVTEVDSCGVARTIPINFWLGLSFSSFAFHSLHAKLTKSDVMANTLRSSLWV